MTPGLLSAIHYVYYKEKMADWSYSWSVGFQDSWLGLTSTVYAFVNIH